MYEVTVEAGFSSGHYLRNYKGKCENPHGHNYKVRVTLAGAALDAAGLLLDFKLLKQVMRPVIDRIDHQMLNDRSRSQFSTHRRRTLPNSSSTRPISNWPA